MNPAQYAKIFQVFRILWILYTIQNKHLVMGKRIKIHMLNFDAEKMDKNYVESFSRWNSSSNIYVVNVIRTSPLIFIDIFVTNLDAKRSIYKINNKNGCDFLNNVVMSKFFTSFYNQLVLNGSDFKCPLKPQKVFLRNAFTADIIPAIHPSGTFELKVALKPKPEARALLVLVWRYKVSH